MHYTKTSALDIDNAPKKIACKRMFTSSLTHQRYVHDDQLFLCVDHEHEVPNNDAYHDEHGSS